MTEPSASSVPAVPGQPGTIPSASAGATIAPVPADPLFVTDAGADASAAPSPTPSRRRRQAGLFLGAFVLGVAVVLVVAGAGLAAWDSSYQGRVAPGVRVGTTDLSGLDQAGAAAALEAAYPYDRGSLVLRTPRGDVTVPYSAFDRRADVGDLVDAAMAAGRDASLPSRVVSQLGQALHGVTLTPHVLMDQQKLAAAVSTALAPLAQSPVDATIAMADGAVVTTPALDGAAVDPAPVIATAAAALSNADAPSQVVVPVATTPVPPTVTDAAVQAAATRAAQIIGPVTVRFGKQSWVLKAPTVRSWIGFTTGADGSVQVTVDATKIPKALASVGKKIARPATSAVFLRAKSGKIVGVVASSDGRQLDTAATSQAIAAALLARAPRTAAAPVAATTGPVAPKLTTAQAKLKAPVLSLLGSWTTWFPISNHNFFGANIWIPAQIINGTLVAPGQTFDWWGAVGAVTPARGFGPGGVIQGNHTDPTGALGGGMCSSSTTLFNAALRAGLQMGARANHLYYINRYPLGLDATVWKIGGAVQDMSFTNDMRTPILILGIKTVGSGGRGFVTYQIWGTPDGRTVSLSAPFVSNVVQATTNIQYVATLPHGVRQQTEYPSNQMDVSVSRVVRDRGGHVIHSEVWQSHYVLWNGIIQVGQ